MGKVSRKGMPFPTLAGGQDKQHGTGGLSLGIWSSLLVVQPAQHDTGCWRRACSSLQCRIRFYEQIGQRQLRNNPQRQRKD